MGSSIRPTLKLATRWQRKPARFVRNARRLRHPYERHMACRVDRHRNRDPRVSGFMARRGTAWAFAHAEAGKRHRRRRSTIPGGNALSMVRRRDVPRPVGDADSRPRARLGDVPRRASSDQGRRWDADQVAAFRDVRRHRVRVPSLRQGRDWHARGTPAHAGRSILSGPSQRRASGGRRNLGADPRGERRPASDRGPRRHAQ